MTTAYSLVHSPGHDYPGHPESPQRFSELEECIRSIVEIEAVAAAPAHPDEIGRVHTPRLMAELEAACQQGPAIIDFAPTFVAETSFDDALLAAGGTLACTRAVLDGEAANAFAIVRPPGHHAEPGRAMGFCLFNNIAVAGRDALERGMERILVVDFDAHHGNGTQAAFWKDERAAYLSTHQEGIYPGTGWAEEAPHARGRIVNAPLPAYAGDACFTQIVEQIVRPFVAAFRPQMMFVSAGYDSHWNDPIAALGLSTAGFFALSARLVELAKEFCQGKIVFALEGGYDPRNVANGVSASLAALTGSASAPEAEDASPRREPDISALLSAIRKLHGFGP